MLRIKFKVCGSQDIEVADRVLDVSGQHHNIYMFCCEHIELVHGGVEAGTLDSIEACAQVLERYNVVWIEVHMVVGIFRLRLGREYIR
jgi:hypothetical protein